MKALVKLAMLLVSMHMTSVFAATIDADFGAKQAHLTPLFHCPNIVGVHVRAASYDAETDSEDDDEPEDDDADDEET